MCDYTYHDDILLATMGENVCVNVVHFVGEVHSNPALSFFFFVDQLKALDADEFSRIMRV